MQMIRKLDEVFHEKADPIDVILGVWSDWMSLNDANTSEPTANPSDVREFMNIGAAVDTMINDLKRHQWWAIRKSRGFCSVWIFSGQHYDQHLQQAREELEKKMRSHVATRKYFN